MKTPSIPKTHTPSCSGNRAVILLSCPDQVGIVAEVAYFVSTYNGNIVHASQHKDLETNTFFMRIEWDLEAFTVPKGKIASSFEPLVLKYKMNWSLHFTDDKPNVAIFVSKFDHCLYELCIRNQSGDFDCRIKAVISNHPDCKPIADYFGIPFFCIPVSPDTKTEAEAAQLQLLSDLHIDLIVLARYMQILSPRLTLRYPNQIINIHHSFLPAFVGAKPYRQAFDRGVKLIGATAHYVTEDLDQGPIIEQDVSRITHRDTVDDLMRKGRELEKQVLATAVKLHLEHRILVFNNKTINFEHF